MKSQNPLVFSAKTENQVLKNGKSANCNEHQNGKIDLKNSQNRKTENPNASLVKLLCFHSRWEF